MSGRQIKRKKKQNMKKYLKDANRQLKIHNTVLMSMRLRFRIRYAWMLIWKKLDNV